VIRIVRAIAVGGQVVRAVFDKAPKTRSAAANDDGLNGANYTLAITVGTGKTPLCVGTLGKVAYPAYGVLNPGEVGVDIQTDRSLVIGLSYSLLVAARIVAFDGDLLAPPYSVTFIGAARAQRRRQAQSNQGVTDFNSGSTGLTVSNGDIENVTGIPSTKLRCLRRTTTMKNAFAHLPGYGTGFQPKIPMTTNRVGALKNDLAQQLKSEPDVRDAATKVSLDARGLVTVELRVRTKAEQTFSLTVNGSTS
jgi:hypothetical protein